MIGDLKRADVMDATVRDIAFNVHAKVSLLSCLSEQFWSPRLGSVGRRDIEFPIL